MAIRTKAYNDDGEHIGWYEHGQGWKRFIPLENFHKEKVLQSNEDFEGIVNRFKSDEHKTDVELIAEQRIMLNELERLSSFERMSSRKKYELLATARKAFNRYYTYADTVFFPNKLDDLQQRFQKFTLELNKYTHIKKQPQGLDLSAYRQTLAATKAADLKQNLEKCLFQYTQRITLFDMYKKGNLEQDMIKQALGNRGNGLDYDQQIDELMTILEKEFPTGYLKVPVVTVSEKNGVKVQKKNSRQISLDYYIRTWLADVNASFDNAMIESAYMQAGLDLVLMRNEGEDACPVCGPATNKIFSLSGTDPDFPIAPYRPAHPNCDCYLVPMMTEDFWRKNPLTQDMVDDTKAGFKQSFKNYQEKTADKRAELIKEGKLTELDEGIQPLVQGIIVDPSSVDPDEGFGNPEYGYRKPGLSDTETLLQSLFDSDIIKYGENIRNAIRAGEMDTDINYEKQKRHDKNKKTDEWRSELTVDPASFTKKYAGTGEFMFDEDLLWDMRELIVAEEEVGQFIHKNNRIGTNKAVIVYSKTGTHVYPVNPQKEGMK